MKKALAGFLAGVAVTIGLMAAALPYCPTEDSCKADYYRHSWHIIETRD